MRPLGKQSKRPQVNKLTSSEYHKQRRAIQ